MWLRDSTNQFLPYILMPKQCPQIRNLALGLIRTQAELIMIDPYTNAFKKEELDVSKRHSYLNDKTETLLMGISVDLTLNRQFATRSIWERKYEIDSLASFLRLTYQFTKRYNDTSFVDINFIKAIKRIISLIDEQTKDENYQRLLKKNYYTFNRNGQELPQGKIQPSSYTGMIKTAFRPSDDANQLPFNIPGNAMASTFLELVAKNIILKIPQRSVYYSMGQILGLKMMHQSKSIRQAIFDYGVVQRNGVKIFAYEVNGRGESKLYDDANLPSLLSLPYMRFIDKKEIMYRNTRKFLLSKQNIFFFQTNNIKGIGSSHTNNNFIWPLALITQIMTSDDMAEIQNCLDSLVKSAKNNLMHQSFSISQPSNISREWFAWANSFFGQMIVYLTQKAPDILLR